MKHRTGGASKHKMGTRVAVSGLLSLALWQNHSKPGRFAIRCFEGLRSKFGRFAVCHSEGFNTSYWKAFDLSQVGLLAIVLCHSPAGLLSLIVVVVVVVVGFFKCVVLLVLLLCTMHSPFFWDIPSKTLRGICWS